MLGTDALSLVINRQMRELNAAGADEVVFEYEHGDAVVKQQLQSLLDAVQEGNTIKQKRLVIVGSITFACRTGQIDPMSQAFVQMSAVFAELELSIIRARIRSGMQNGKAEGKPIGRSRATKNDVPAIFLRHYPGFVTGKLNVSELARVCGVSRPTVYKYLKLLG